MRVRRKERARVAWSACRVGDHYVRLHSLAQLQRGKAACSRRGHGARRGRTRASRRGCTGPPRCLALPRDQADRELVPGPGELHPHPSSTCLHADTVT